MALYIDATQIQQRPAQVQRYTLYLLFYIYILFICVYIYMCVSRSQLLLAEVPLSLARYQLGLQSHETSQLTTPVPGWFTSSLAVDQSHPGTLLATSAASASSASFASSIGHGLIHSVHFCTIFARMNIRHSMSQLFIMCVFSCPAPCRASFRPLPLGLKHIYIRSVQMERVIKFTSSTQQYFRYNQHGHS